MCADQPDRAGRGMGIATGGATERSEVRSRGPAKQSEQVRHPYFMFGSRITAALGDAVPIAPLEASQLRMENWRREAAVEGTSFLEGLLSRRWNLSLPGQDHG